MINGQGIMLSVLGNDYFLSYNRIPWMQDAPIRSVLNVQMSGSRAIEWPDLDIDLEIESLRHPERYPLVMKRNPLDFVSAWPFSRLHRPVAVVATLILYNLQISVSVRPYLIDIELFALVLCIRIPPNHSSQREHAVESSRL